MRVAALYDIHGNLPALEAVLRDVREAAVDHIVVGGDVLPGPMPVECLDLLRSLDVPTSFISGNGEREVLAILSGSDKGTAAAQYRPMLQWVGEQLGETRQRWIAEWPNTLRLTINGVGAALFCHATPRSDSEIFLETTPNEVLQAVFGDMDAALVVCGHTHMQFDRIIAGVRVVNAGSVGMPFDEPGAYWLLLGPHVELRFTDYDLEAAARAISATAYPQSQAFADRYVLNPPSKQEMSAAFSRSEIGASTTR